MPYYEEHDLNRFSEIGKHRPDLFEKFMAWCQACQEDDALSRREKALIGLAVAHALQCPIALMHIHTHASKAVRTWIR